jgi:RNA polymerase sigma-70 factor, ECF subfamily
MNDIAGALAVTVVKATTALEREFEADLSKWSSLAFRVAYSVLRHREDAEDIAQDVLTNAYRKLGQLRDRDRLRAWLVRMAWRLAINKRGSDVQRLKREETVSVPATPTFEDTVLSAERTARLWEAIDRLPESLRYVVILASIQEHDLAEVAATLGIPVGTVKSRLFEARKQLRERLQ